MSEKEVQKKYFDNRVFVPGMPTKGKIAEAIRVQIPNNWRYEFDRDFLLDPANWEPGTQADVPGHFVTVRFKHVEVTPVLAESSAAPRDSQVQALTKPLDPPQETK